jgi:hypothetical protein
VAAGLPVLKTLDVVEHMGSLDGAQVVLVAHRRHLGQRGVLELL